MLLNFLCILLLIDPSFTLQSSVMYNSNCSLKLLCIDSFHVASRCLLLNEIVFRSELEGKEISLKTMNIQMILTFNMFDFLVVWLLYTILMYLKAVYMIFL